MSRQSFSIYQYRYMGVIKFQMILENPTGQWGEIWKRDVAAGVIDAVCRWRFKEKKTEADKFMDAMRFLVDHFGFNEAYIRGLGPDKVLRPRETWAERFARGEKEKGL